MAKASFEAGCPTLEQVEPLVLRRGQEGKPEHLGPGNDMYFGSHGADRAYGQGGDDFLQGFNGKDLLDGGSGDDTINGGKGRDFIFGGRGDDHIRGEGGHDVLDGGAGTDSIALDDDSQSDRVVFSRASDSLPGAAHDTVWFFETGVDRIDLRPIDADSSTRSDDAFTWIGGAAFGGVAGELRFEPGPNVLQGDVDGDGTADFEVYFNGSDYPQVTDILL